MRNISGRNFKERHPFELRGPATSSREKRKETRRQSTRKRKKVLRLLRGVFGPAGRRREVRPWGKNTGGFGGKGNAPCTLGRVLCVQQQQVEEKKKLFSSSSFSSQCRWTDPLLLSFSKHSSEIFKWNLFFLFFVRRHFLSIFFPSSKKFLVHLFLFFKNLFRCAEVDGRI